MPTSPRAAFWTRSSVVFLAALAVRVGAVFALGHYRAPTLWENGVVARYLLAGCGFCMDFSLPGEPSSWQAPGYPALLFAAWRLLGEGPAAHLALSLLQAVALASMVFPVRALARRWLGEGAAAFAAWIVCFLPIYPWYATRLHQAGLVMAVHPWLLWLWLRLRERPTALGGLAAGATSGLAAMLQPLLFFLSGALGCGLLVERLRRSPDRRALGALALAAGAALLTVAPWTLRNFGVHGRFVPIKDSFGKEFWMGNNPHATGTGYARGGEVEITSAFPPRAMALRGQVAEAELMEAMLAEGLAYVRAEPLAFVERTVRKVVWFWTIAPSDRVRRASGGEALRFRRLHLGYWACLVAAALAEVLLRRGLPREYGAVIALFLLTYSLVYGLTHVGQARYRGEMEFILIPLAAAAVARLLDRR